MVLQTKRRQRGLGQRGATAAHRMGPGALQPLEPRILMSTYYVSPAGSDLAAGTSTGPWQTLQRAANVVTAGDTVVVRAGRYAGFTLGHGNPQTGISGKPILFRGETNAIIDAPNGLTADAISIDGASYVTIQSFRFDNTAGQITGAAVRTANNDHVTIRSNTIDLPASAGVWASASSNLFVYSNMISRSATGAGVLVTDGSDRPIIRLNRIWGNNGSAVALSGGSVVTSDGIITSALVEQNTIYNNGASGAAAIFTDGAQSARIQNNVLYGNSADGISLGRQASGGNSINSLVINNTVVQPDGSGWALRLSQGSTGGTIYNNILLGGSGAMAVSDDSRTGLFSDYNALAGSLSLTGGTSIVDLAQWRSGTGKDLHSLSTSAAALFTSPSTNNYHLSATSPAVNSGTNLASPKQAPRNDFEGNARPSGTAWDIGADERDVVPPKAAPTAADVTASGASSYRFTVNYTDSVAVRAATIGASDVLVSGPGGYSQVARFISVNAKTDGTSRTATYEVTAPGGAWDFADNGTYTLDILSGAVTDTSDNAVPAGTVGTFQVSVAGVAKEASVKYLLTSDLLTAARAKATANTAQWQAFKKRLDAELKRVTFNSYQGGSLTWASDFALGYQVLKDIDPVTASQYADKAIAVLSSGLTNDLNVNSGTRMFLARGNGVQKQFTLPNSDINTATFRVLTTPVKVKAVVKGAANGQDAVEASIHFLSVSLTSDGPVNYVKGVDWRRNADYASNMIDWSLPGNEPAAGTTYYVTEASGTSATQVSGWTRTGNSLVFTTAPAANTAIFVEYQYGTSSGGQSTLGYQQTTDGQGGFNNIYIDSSYSSRYLKHMAAAVDWLWDYQGLSTTLRSNVSNMLVRWSDYLRDNGYKMHSPASNYGAGHYAFRVATALALQGRSADADRLMTEVLAYRDGTLLPLLQPPAAGQASLAGGHWAEGWNYGPLAVRNILTSALALEGAGAADISMERAWANDVMQAVLTEQPTQSTIYDGGDGYTWPLPVPDKTMFTDVGFLASDPKMKAYANWAIQNYTGTPLAGGEDLLYRDPSATATFWGGSLPLQYLAEGTGLALARKDWNYNSTWLSFQSGNLVSADHQTYAQGQLNINRGADALLANAAAVSQLYEQDKSRYGNLVLIDDGGAGEQTYRNAQGYWYGTPGCTIKHFAGDARYAYVQGDYAGAYRRSNGTANPATELVRSVFYVRDADYVIVYDRATTTKSTYLKQVQWHFTATPTVSGNSWNVAVGSSKLFGQTLSSVALTTTKKAVNTKVQQVATKNSSAATSVRYVTAMQVAPSTATAMVATTRIMSADAKLEGVKIGQYVIMFGRNGAVTGNSSYQLTAASGQKVTHYVSDLAPGTTYTLSGADQTSAKVSAEGVLTFTSTGNGTAQTVGLTAGTTSAFGATPELATASNPETQPLDDSPLATTMPKSKLHGKKARFSTVLAVSDSRMLM